MRFVGYHGSPHKYTQYDLAAAQKVGAGQTGPFNNLGLWLSSSPEMARFFGNYVYAYEVELHKPFVIEREGWRQPFADGLYFEELAKKHIPSKDRKVLKAGMQVAWESPEVRTLVGFGDRNWWDGKGMKLRKLRDDYVRATHDWLWNKPYWTAVKSMLLQLGFDSVAYPNSTIDTGDKDPPHDVVVVLQPEKLKGEIVASNPPSKEVVGYHCTSEESAVLILKSGFQYMDVSTDFIVEAFVGIMDLLGVAGEEREQLEELYVANPDAAAELLKPAWNKKFGHGCTIWISEKKRQMEFGAVCLKVKLPKTAAKLVEMLDGAAYWLPMERIPANRFRGMS